ncbi:MAG TPA: FAD-binding oxidoreductase [Solirubrobacteraceae bacterium]|nr:FAD-binding oxidoreductase [Solirubrobacteraceae bacterium]
MKHISLSGLDVSRIGLGTTAASQLGDLTSMLEGKVVLPEDARFDEAREAWNLAIDQRPSCVVFPESPQDVAAAVLFAAESGQRIAAQGTGHNAAPLGSLEDTILLKTERMRGITIDPVARTVRVESGARWLEVVEAAAPHGLAALAGSSPDVGVTGYTLGGGMSFLARKYGLSANHVRSIDLVTADGRLVRADRDNERDLFWALRGGGGSFGVVIAIEIELLPINRAYAGILWYPLERSAEVLGAWRELTDNEQLPDELTTIARFLNLPPIPDFPEEIRGKSFVTVEAYHVGDSAQADGLLAPLRALGPIDDTIASVPMPALSHLHMDPEQPVPVLADGLMLNQLPAEALDAFVAVAGGGAESPLLSVELRHLGGELGRAQPQNGALSSIQAQYALLAVGLVPAPELESRARAQVAAVKEALAPWASRHMYLNFAETRRDPRSFWTEQAYRRLRRIKARVDPGNIIRANHPIPPAR